ncbi:uncharacterized protein LOC110022919 [Phalaenopsis equestris]|uniref:uncharacterized protein LOC110022919 n=1 Tax=Phalaenopsis equestris TaxID=78828 RepID=UPI0009E64043|nr:uncharacterized protein LOC110022919 [Phalaenopsis equestris]
MRIAVISPFPPLSASFPLPSPARSVFFHSSRPSISSLPLYSSSASRHVHQWGTELQEFFSRRQPVLGRVSGIVSGVADGAQEIIPEVEDGPSGSVISALLLAAFIGLSLLTIGVIYLAVQDFLQKREREKFEKEEAEKKKKDGKKKKVRARAGPRGFGQKIDEEDDD